MLRNIVIINKVIFMIHNDDMIIIIKLFIISPIVYSAYISQIIFVIQL